MEKNIASSDVIAYPIGTGTLVEQVAARLRHDVLSGQLAPMVKLKVDELQKNYGASSSPLREALNRLAQEGLIKADERRGFRVPALSAADLNDIVRMRLMLDVQALRESIALGDDAWEADIVASFHRLEKMEQRYGDGPAVLDDEWMVLHRSFHFALMAACPSPRQLAWSASLFDQAERYRRFSARHRQTPHSKVREHHRLMKAVLARETDTACLLLADHIRNTQRNVEKALLRLANA
jgi:DNA-binding GntR family transcriptional regulator